jgi:hypothetical protein
VLLVLFIALMIWLLPKIWRGIKSVFRFIGRVLGVVKEEPAVPPPAAATPPTAGGPEAPTIPPEPAQPPPEK